MRVDSRAVASKLDLKPNKNCNYCAKDYKDQQKKKAYILSCHAADAKRCVLKVEHRVIS